MKALQWWNQRDARERYLLAGGLGVLILLALYLTLEPGINENARMRDELPQLQADLAWMQDHVAELKTLTVGPGPKSEPTSTEISLASVQSTVRELALQEAVNELKPMPDNAIQLDFTEISFPALMELMYQLRERTGARVRSAEFSRIENTSGAVRASIILGR